MLLLSIVLVLLTIHVMLLEDRARILAVAHLIVNLTTLIVTVK